MDEYSVAAMPDSGKQRDSGMVVLGLTQLSFGTLGMLGTVTGFINGLITLCTEGLKYDQPTFDDASSLWGYFWISAFLIVVGIGTINAYRWTRSLAIAVGWIVFIAVLTNVVTGARLSLLLSTLDQSGVDLYHETGGMAFKPLTFYISLGRLLLGFTLLMVFAYSNKRVRVTCEHLHPEPCWTDRLPMSVLFLACLMVISGMWTLSWLKPVQLSFHGIPINILVKNTGVLLLVLACFLSAWGLFRLRLWGWWVGLILQPLDLVLLALLESTGVLALLGIPGSFGPYATFLTPAVMLGSLTNIAIIFVVFFIARRHFTHATCVPEAQEEALPSPTGV